MVPDLYRSAAAGGVGILAHGLLQSRCRCWGRAEQVLGKFEASGQRQRQLRLPRVLVGWGRTVALMLSTI
ncbi:MAG: hypothetical protein ACREP9_16615 [Candidatus Dormibacteraceae bacterium]